MSTLLSLQYPLILASNSPRRKEILTQAGFDFTILPADIDESIDPSWQIEEVPGILAEKKAQVLAMSCPSQLILAADTIVVVDGQILNKPADKQEAREMLLQLSGKDHDVYTGISLIGPGGVNTQVDRAIVSFRSLLDWEIDWYVKGGSSLDKAGAYGVQDFIGMVGISRLEGSFYTVMGLPIHRVYQMMQPYILEGRQSMLPF
ncbi:septum formation protein Maf [Cytophagaceae bacterium 50C-KIRBA]|uniref:dTTP/UTP pyrophosphatase n=1 Tax=Aquirufa beregesia TaxID=2516556 RepID=A0ABX0F0S6_9BACT|nr:Maf family protein [Aquirufa beregesia]NGZ43425.1 septum formation protein Maf [Aquirufa beregesia]